MMKIDGVQIAKTILSNLKKRVSLLKKKNLIPHLAVILVGKDPSSVSYVNQKEIKGKKIGVKITIKNILSNITQSKLLSTIQQFNNDNNVHGIIVQRPLPENIDSKLIALAINPEKDVDGFHPKSYFKPPIALAVLRTLDRVYYTSPLRSPSIHACQAGELASLRSTSEVARPGTVWHLARQRPRLLGGEFLKWLTPKKIVIVGKGETGGKPIIDLLKKMNIEPSIIDTKTKNPSSIIESADVVISAVGKANVIKPEMIKKGVILIGVGLHKGNDGKLHGDYNEEKIKNIASFYAPTPGGVGPVNVAMLLKNLVSTAESTVNH